MTLAHGTDRLESARLVLRRVAPDDLPFFTRIHALPEVAQGLYPGGRPRSPEQSAAWLRATLASYARRALGHLAVLRREDGALIGRCGLTALVVETAAPEHGIRRGWFGDAQAPTGIALTFECELGYTFDPAVWGQGFATEAVRCVRDYARDVLWLSYAVSAILPQNARSRRVAERFGVRAAGQMEVLGLTWDRYVWPLATGGAARPQRALRNRTSPHGRVRSSGGEAQRRNAAGGSLGSTPGNQAPREISRPPVATPRPMTWLSACRTRRGGGPSCVMTGKAVPMNKSPGAWYYSQLSSVISFGQGVPLPVSRNDFRLSRKTPHLVLQWCMNSTGSFQPSCLNRTMVQSPR